MNPVLAKTLVDQRREELTRTTAQTRRSRGSGPWLSRHMPRWHVSWSRTVLSPATGSAAADGGNPTRRQGGSSLVIIISAHR
jgi:hypothetical protein